MSNDLSPWEKYKQNLGQTRPWDLLKSDIKRTEEKDADARYAICLACPELVKITKQCKKCGCFMKAKVQLEAATCPLGKW